LHSLVHTRGSSFESRALTERRHLSIRARGAQARLPGPAPPARLVKTPRDFSKLRATLETPRAHPHIVCNGFSNFAFSNFNSEEILQ